MTGRSTSSQASAPILMPRSHEAGLQTKMDREAHTDLERAAEDQIGDAEVDEPSEELARR